LRLIAASLILLSLNTALAAQSYPWPNNARAAVSLSYDDALHSQLDNAIPTLNKYNLKGSFYLSLSSSAYKQRINEWQTIAMQGHELGNHTINHACSGAKANREWVSAGNDLDNIPLSKLINEIIEANKQLHQLDKQSHRTFTLPCGDAFANGKNYHEAIKHLFTGIKSRVGGIETSMTGFDIKNVSVIAPSNISGEQLISYVKRAANYGTMVNFTFHGIGGDHLSVSEDAHAKLVKFLADNSELYWVDTFRNISLHISNNQE